MVNREIGGNYVNSEEYSLKPEERLSEEEIQRRRLIGEYIVKIVPLEALENLQIFQPAIGCVNRCNFCSQHAGPIARELDVDSLQTIMGGLKDAMTHYGLKELGGERSHKPGVIFPYLDNDIGSYPHLLEYIDGMSSLNTKTRLSTVGWSRHNHQLQTMHENIAQDKQENVDGIRFSLTPYTHGWRTNHDEYVSDLANAVDTYRPFIDTHGTSRRTGCIEIRFKPDVMSGDIERYMIGRYNIVRCNEYTLISQGGLDEMTSIGAMGVEGPELSNSGQSAINIIGDGSGLQSEEEIGKLFESLDKKNSKTFDKKMIVSKGRAFTFSNDDGNYFCFNPLRTGDGFNAVHYYPRTMTRLPGVLDATRPFLNSLISYKKAKGYEARDDLPFATQEDIDAILASIRSDSEEIGNFSRRRAEYIRSQVLPLVEDAAEIIKRSNLTPDYFFKYGFLIDTGIIVNQGKALSEFNGLASRADIPLTPNEEKGYGSTSQSSVRGISWRVAPVETISSDDTLGTYGLKSLPLIDQEMPVESRKQNIVVKLGFFALNPEAYTTKDNSGNSLPAFYIPLPESANTPLRKVTPASSRRDNLLPGNKI